MTLRQPNEHYTVADYEHWEGDWELWSGRPVAMSPSPAPRHGAMLVELGAVLRNALKDHDGCRCTAFAEIDWRVTLDTVVRPDLSIVCGPPLTANHINRPPTLIAEILSPTTAHRDRTAKWDLYASQSVTHYLIVDQDTGNVEAHTRSGDTYTPTAEGDHGFELELHDGCRITIPATLTV